MKRLLSILAAATLVASASSPVVACSINGNVDESIAPSLETQNFKALEWLGTNTDKSVLDYIDNSGKLSHDDAVKSLLFSNGLTGDNKYLDLDNSLNSLTGSFNSNRWSFLDMLNEKFNLGMKANAKKNEPDLNSLGEKVKASDLLKYVTPEISHFDELGKIRVSASKDANGKVTTPAVEASLQANGQPPVTSNSNEIVKRFNDWLNLGSSINGTYDWRRDKALIEGETYQGHNYSGEWSDATVTKKTNVVYSPDNKNKSNFVFTQIIRLTNTSVLHDYLFGKDGKSGAVKELQDFYNANLKGQDTYSFDDMMNNIFQSMNIFTAVKQGYSVSADTDCNYIVSQIRNKVNNIIKTVNDDINDKNSQTIAKAIMNQNDGGYRLQRTDETRLLSAELAASNIIDVKGNNLISNDASSSNVKVTLNGSSLGSSITVTPNGTSGFSITLGTDISKLLSQTGSKQDVKITYTPSYGEQLNTVLSIKPISKNIITGADDNTIDLSKIDASNFAAKYNLLPRDNANKSSYESKLLSQLQKEITTQINQEVWIRGLSQTPIISSSDLSVAKDRIKSQGPKLVEKTDKIAIVSATGPSISHTATTDDFQTFKIVTRNIKDNPDVKSSITIDNLPSGISLSTASVSNNVLTVVFNKPISRAFKDQEFALTYKYNDGTTTAVLSSTLDIPALSKPTMDSTATIASDKTIVVGVQNMDESFSDKSAVSIEGIDSSEIEGIKVEKGKLTISLNDPINKLINQSFKDSNHKIAVNYKVNDAAIVLTSNLVIPGAIINYDTSQSIIGEIDLSYDDNNLYKAEGLTENSGIILGAALNDKLNANDLLHAKLGIVSSDTLEQFEKNNYVDLSSSSYKYINSAYAVRNTWVNKSDVKNLLDTIQKNYETLTYKDSLNINQLDNLQINLVYTDQDYNQKSLQLIINESKMKR